MADTLADTPNVLDASDYAKAARMLRPAEQGQANAQANLGAMYCSGLGVARDHHKTAMWWERAAKQNHAQAQ